MSSLTQEKRSGQSNGCHVPSEIESDGHSGYQGADPLEDFRQTLVDGLERGEFFYKKRHIPPGHWEHPQKASR